jgi:hypothetical protein
MIVGAKESRVIVVQARRFIFMGLVNIGNAVAMSAGSPDTWSQASALVPSAVVISMSVGTALCVEDLVRAKTIAVVVMAKGCIPQKSLRVTAKIRHKRCLPKHLQKIEMVTKKFPLQFQNAKTSASFSSCRFIVSGLLRVSSKGFLLRNKNGKRDTLESNSVAAKRAPLFFVFFVLFFFFFCFSFCFFFVLKIAQKKKQVA